MSRSRLLTFLCVAVALGLAAPAQAAHNEDLHDDMRLVFNSPTGQINSDLAFWGDQAFVGNYGGFRIFDISSETPTLVTNFQCFGPQNDPSVWDRDGDGTADLLIMSVDAVLTSPECGSPTSSTPDEGWEGLRIFDLSNPTSPQLIAAVYQDCGSHTNTLVPRPEEDRLLVLNQSYPLRPGPTCGPDNGPAVGRDPLHGVIQVVEVPLDDPADAHEIAELPIDYPGDPDNTFVPAEHGLPQFNPIRACHDVGVFLELNLAGGACAEQAQLWRIDPSTGLPDTANPIWVFDDTEDTDGPGGGDIGADFWHSATFSWDGKVVNFIDESFGGGCPPTTPGVGDTGRMFFLSTNTGEKLSHFMINRDPPGDVAGDYCSAHLGAFVPMPGRDLLVDAWYRGGANVVDATSPRNPREIAFWDGVNADNWSAYWYEQNPHPGSKLTLWGNDGVHAPATGRGFEKFEADIRGRRVGLDHFNPQVQEEVIKSARKAKPARGSRGFRGRGKGARASKAGKVDRRAAARRLAP